MEPRPRTNDTPNAESVNGMKCGASLAQRAALLVRVAAAGCALMFGITACDDVAPRPDETKKPDSDKPGVDYSFVGDYHATTENTVIGLKVTRDRFTALTITRTPAQAAPRRADIRVDPVRHASAHGKAMRAAAAEEETLIVSGTVGASGGTVTATITEVARNGQALTDDELDRYTSCSITATIGAGFARESVTAILECLRVPTDDGGVSDIEREPPETSIHGTWDIELGDQGAGHLADLTTLSIVVSTTYFGFSVRETRCPLYWQPGPTGPTGPTGQPGQPGPTGPGETPPPPPPPELSFDYGGPYSTIAVEGEPIEFVVILSPPASETATVDWTTVDESGDYLAVAGADYTAARGTLTFPTGQSRRSLTVMTIDDNAVEGFKYFRVELANAKGADIVQEFDTGQIIDDEDDRPCITYDLHYDVEAIDGTNISLVFRNGEFRLGLAPNEQVEAFDRNNFRDFGGSPLPPHVSPDDLDLDVSVVVVSGPSGAVAHFRFEGWIGGFSDPDGGFFEVLGYRQ